MASFDRSFTSSPVVVMPPQAVHQASLDGPLFSSQSLSFGSSTFTSPSWSTQPVATPVSAGRKRSRDEAAVNLDEPEKKVEAIKEPEDEWVYGPGMTLVKRDQGYVADASSQSGTWVDQKAAEADARKADAALLVQKQLSQDRPSLRSSKSQRLAMTTPMVPGQQPPTNRSSPGRELGKTPPFSADSSMQPVVDDFTLHLGIGWNRISEDDHIQAAARGWARFIEKHFPVSNAVIRLESKGLGSYLVETNEGFYLFEENLRQGQLVSKDPQRALENLRTSPPVFDGAETMTAAESPRPLSNTSSEPSTSTWNNQFATYVEKSDLTTSSADIDMDMN